MKTDKILSPRLKSETKSLRSLKTSLNHAAGYAHAYNRAQPHGKFTNFQVGRRVLCCCARLVHAKLLYFRGKG